ncbi:RluA family pseudouridine synthase [Methylophaga frappieri]|nr:RluA family pseudouridine synthase [Methylophaga frappieri]
MSEQHRRFKCQQNITHTGQTVIDCLASLTDLSRQQLKQCLQKGAVRLRHGRKVRRVRRATLALQPGQQIELHYDSVILAQATPAIQPVADKVRYTVWDKPAGILAQGTEWGDHCSLLRIAELVTKRPVFLVHRLDKEASGLMIIAHDHHAAGQLSHLFQQREMFKQYRAVLSGQMTANEQHFAEPLDGREANTTIQRCHYDAESNQSHVTVTIGSGRKHQIRRHCAAAGLPLIGDSIYGQPHSGGLQLRATVLHFPCPLTKQQQHFELNDK